MRKGLKLVLKVKGRISAFAMFLVHTCSHKRVPLSLSLFLSHSLSFLVLSPYPSLFSLLLSHIMVIFARTLCCCNKSVNLIIYCQLVNAVRQKPISATYYVGCYVPRVRFLMAAPCVSHTP